MTEYSRSSGVQLHVTSLPGGRLGVSAFRFVDWLAEAGQSWWQVLPLGPPDRHLSPYKARSAFACWPGLLASPHAPVSDAEVASFRSDHSFWIGGWEPYGSVLDQVRFAREWGALRSYASSAGVRLIGDVPIYVAPSSADVLQWPELFQQGFVAGTPPDVYTETGQLWGNPLYYWPALQRRGYRWWIERLRRTFELFDLARLDHFRGFVSYWSVPEGSSTALHGRWRRGPGAGPFHATALDLGLGVGELPLIAEDLGVITPAVDRLRDSLGLPGMLVLQFGFDPLQPRSVHRFERHVEHRIVYTGTHDSDTAVGWFSSLGAAERGLVDDELRLQGISLGSPSWDLIALTMKSRARVAILQAQDLLGLGSEARMNYPGREGGWWRWRLPEDALTAALARRLRELTAEYGRLPRA